MMKQHLRACQVVASINEHTGGTAFSVTNIARNLQMQNIESSIFTLNYQNRGKQVVAKGVDVYSEQAKKLAWILPGFQPSSSKNLSDLAAEKFDLIHNHGLWMFTNLYARQAAKRHKLPLFISPRGTLESWSLQNSKYKKKLAWWLYEKGNLGYATAFHATSANEVESIRKLGFKQPIALIPNGVDLPLLDTLPSKEILISLFPNLANSRWLLFLSRIHPKKGLDNLIKIWGQIKEQFPDWHLIIAGPNSIGYQAELERLTKELHLGNRITFTGMLSGDLKASALGNADLFVLPTHSENFGIAVAESLVYAVPAITTKEAPWQDLVNSNCGWWVEDDLFQLKLALIKSMKLSNCQLKSMGKNGRNLVAEKYSWEFASQQMAEFYRWILHGGNVPNFVQVT